MLAWAERRQALDPSPGTAEWVGWACKDLAELHAARGENDEALELLERARRELEAAKMHEWDAKGFEDLGKRIEELRAGVKEE